MIFSRKKVISRATGFPVECPVLPEDPCSTSFIRPLIGGYRGIPKTEMAGLYDPRADASLDRLLNVAHFPAQRDKSPAISKAASVLRDETTD